MIHEVLEVDPFTYDEAINDINVNHQKKAMKSKIESMYSNHVQKLIDLHNEVKPIGCKWVYKRKRGIDGKIKTFKSRLIAKGYNQKEGIDYEDTFSPVAMIKSIRIPFSIVATLDYEIWQRDVKIEFLNGNQTKASIWCNQKDLCQKTKSAKPACYKGPYMDLSKLRYCGPYDSTKLLNFMATVKL